MTSIKERLDAATTASCKWNNWPDQMELVRIEEFDLGDANMAYAAGKMIGKTECMRQIRAENIPEQVGLGLSKSLVNVFFKLDHEHGQEDDPKTRNITALIEIGVVHGGSKSQWRMRPETVFAVTIGCKHDYDTTGSRMCLSVGRCRKCGHKFVCDSSD